MTRSVHPLTLFIIKKCYDYDGHRQVSNGLRTSALFVVNLLLAEGQRSKLVEAVDGNSIDALIAQNKPSRVVIEAIWVTPEKMAELQKLHPFVRWTVRVHSEISFLAQEGCAVAWLSAYRKQGIEVAFNSDQTVSDFKVLSSASFLPNYYPLRKPRPRKAPGNVLHVGCFGAIRPLKNQLIQAFAAVQFAQQKRKPLVFHMNGSRIEQSGNNNLKNIQALFDEAGPSFTLQLHPWEEHEDFLDLLCGMDLCLQVSFSETFNIVSADAVSMGVPLVGSGAIAWLPERSQAAVGDAGAICEAMEHADATSVAMNHDALTRYLKHTVHAWNAWCKA